MVSKKPKTVRFIGWTFIILSILSIVSGIICLWFYFTFRNVAIEELQLDAMSVLVLRTSGVLALVQIIPAVIVLIVSIFFLRLRAFARLGLEIVCWLGLGYSILSLMLIGAFRFSKVPGTETYTSGPNLVFGIALTIAAAVPFIFIISYLRRADIRELFKDPKSINLPS